MSARAIEMTGKRFGRLTVVARAPRRLPSRTTRWDCRCDCGNTANVDGSMLRSGATRSCGCLASELMRSGYRRTHGRSCASSLHRPHRRQRKLRAGQLSLVDDSRTGSEQEERSLEPISRYRNSRSTGARRGTDIDLQENEHPSGHRLQRPATEILDGHHVTSPSIFARLVMPSVVVSLAALIALVAAGQWLFAMWALCSTLASALVTRWLW